MVEAGLLRNPVFDAEARFGREGTGVELAVVQNFLTIFYLPLRKQVGAASFEAAKYEVAGLVLEFVGKTQARFYELQAALEERELWRTILSATEASYDLAKRMHKAGNTTDLDLDNERAFYEQTKLDLASTELAVIQGRERLNALMGLWGEVAANWTIKPRLPELPKSEFTFEQIEGRVIERSVDLTRARSELEVAAAQLRIARPLAIFDEIESGVASEKEPEGGWTFGPAVTFPIPLFNRGQAAASKSLAELRRSEANYRNVAVQIRSEVRIARAALIASRERVVYRRDVLLPLRRKIVKETQKHYNAMLVGAFQLLQAKQSEISSGVAYVRDLHLYWQARSDLEHLLSGGRVVERENTFETPEPREHIGDSIEEG